AKPVGFLRRRRSADAGAGERGDLAERPGIVEGERREDLAVDLDAGGPETGHQAAVRQPVGARRGVDADDPQRADVALLLLAVAVGVGEPPLPRLAGLAVRLAAAADVPLGLLHRLLVAAPRLRAALRAWHRDPSLEIREQALDRLLVRLVHERRLAEAP